MSPPGWLIAIGGSGAAVTGSAGVADGSRVEGSGGAGEVAGACRLGLSLEAARSVSEGAVTGRGASAAALAGASVAGRVAVVDGGAARVVGAGEARGPSVAAGGAVCRVPGKAKSRNCSGPTVPSRGAGAGVTTLAGAALFCAAAGAARPSSKLARMKVRERVTVGRYRIDAEGGMASL